MPSKVAAYARFSSEKQSDASIEDQVRRCRDWGEKNGLAIDEGLVFADFAVSGSSLARPGFDAARSTRCSSSRSIASRAIKPTRSRSTRTSRSAACGC
jgi:predicted site-specific integrase-resolvase